MKLTESQRAAVERQAPEVCVVAGPGSGKTRVLTEHFAWLIEKLRVDPARILAITFTEKAANERKRRLVERFEHSPELRSAMEHAWISTIHAFCARLLRENSIAAGLPPDFAVIEQPVADRLMREAAEEALDAMFDEQPAEMRRLMEALDLATDDDGRQQDLAAALLSVYETMRLSGAREIPAGPASPDVFPEACRCADAILRDPVRGALHSWAAEFRRLDPQNITRAHLESTGSAPIELNRGSKSGAGYEA